MKIKKINKKFLLTFLVINLAALTYYLFFLNKNGYLPSPFLYDKNDTLMDLFNPLFYAITDGAYSQYKSIYPPLNFIFLKFFYWIFNGVDIIESFGCTAKSAFDLRGSSLNIVLAWLSLYLLIPIFVLTTDAWSNFKLDEKIIFYLIFITSIPALFTLERGNLIILALIPLSVALSSKNILREISIGLLINIKPYFILLTLSYFIKARWKEFFQAVAIAAIIFIGTGALFDFSNFLLFFKNIFQYASSNIYSTKEVVDLPSSPMAWVYFLYKSPGNIFSAYTLFRVADLLKFFIYGAFIFWLFLLRLKCSSKDINDLLITIIVFISCFSVNFGGYTIILYFCLLPFLFKFKNSNFMLVIIGLMFLPYFWLPVLTLHYPEVFISYLTGEYIYPIYSLSIGSILRPALNLFFLFFILYEIQKIKSTN